MKAVFLLANVQRTPLFLYTRVADLFGIAINNLQNPSNNSPLTSKSRNYITFTKNSITLYLTDSRVLLHNKIATMITFLHPFIHFPVISNKLHERGNKLHERGIKPHERGNKPHERGNKLHERGNKPNECGIKLQEYGIKPNECDIKLHECDNKPHTTYNKPLRSNILG